MRGVQAELAPAALRPYRDGLKNQQAPASRFIGLWGFVWFGAVGLLPNFGEKGLCWRWSRVWPEVSSEWTPSLEMRVCDSHPSPPKAARRGRGCPANGHPYFLQRGAVAVNPVLPVKRGQSAQRHGNQQFDKAPVSVNRRIERHPDGLDHQRREDALLVAHGHGHG